MGRDGAAGDASIAGVVVADVSAIAIGGSSRWIAGRTQLAILRLLLTWLTGLTLLLAGLAALTALTGLPAAGKLAGLELLTAGLTTGLADTAGLALSRLSVWTSAKASELVA